EALAQSGLEITEEQSARSSALVGSSTGGLISFQIYSDLIRETDNPRKMTPFGVPMLIVNGGTNIVSIMTNAGGPSMVPVSSCATGGDCIGLAYDLIRAGRIDRSITGCGDFPIMPMGVAAFDRIGAYSRDNDNPEGAVRPFDKNRSGMVFGEGAGVIILEELASAKARGATILAEMTGYAATTDAFHRTAPEPEGRGAAEAIQRALDDAKLIPEDIDYINAHGTATALNDSMETKAVKHVFGDNAYKTPMSSTKGATGHAMGTTAAMEAVFSIMAIQENIAPPTLNYETPDPDCDLDYVPNTTRDVQIDAVMSNSFGFGGHNTTLIFQRFND
ncbi:MAG: beta-ketoacyl-[acyl-carrier-protein] synthase family protein, partial [Aggregatilineales bacterium]